MPSRSPRLEAPNQTQRQYVRVGAICSNALVFRSNCKGCELHLGSNAVSEASLVTLDTVGQFPRGAVKRVGTVNLGGEIFLCCVPGHAGLCIEVEPRNRLGKIDDPEQRFRMCVQISVRIGDEVTPWDRSATVPKIDIFQLCPDERDRPHPDRCFPSGVML